MECLCPASTACAPLRPNRASPCAERAGASVRTARQSEDCLRVRPPRSATALRKGRSAVGGDAARGWHGRVGGSGTARHSATADSAFPRDAQSIRECALHGLVDRAGPLSLRPATPPRGVLRIPAQNPLWPRGQRRPSRPRYSQNVGASVAACTSRSAPSMSLALFWRGCAYLARSEAWRWRHEAEQAQTAGRARLRDCACAARREVFRPSAPLRRRGWIARLTADARAAAGNAPQKAELSKGSRADCGAIERTSEAK